MRLIDADKLRKDVIDLPNTYNGFSDTYDKAMIVDIVDEQPTVDAEPIRRGHWNPWRCSKCGERAPIHWDGENRSYAEWLAPYCPSCGAKMDDQEEQDNDSI